MGKEHDENKDVRLVSRIAKLDYSNKTIQAPKSAIIGNKTWGRIDFLTKYRGWSFVWNNEIRVSSKINKSDDDKTNKRDAKKKVKDATLSNKRKRRNNDKNI